VSSLERKKSKSFKDIFNLFEIFVSKIYVLKKKEKYTITQRDCGDYRSVKDTILPMSAGKNITADSAQESQDKTIIQCHNRKWIKIQKNVNYTLLCIYTLKFYDNIFFLYFFFFSCHEKKQNYSILTILKDKTLNVLQQEIIGFGWRIFFEIVLLILPYI